MPSFLPTEEANNRQSHKRQRDGHRRVIEMIKPCHRCFLYEAPCESCRSAVGLAPDFCGCLLLAACMTNLRMRWLFCLYRGWRGSRYTGEGVLLERGRPQTIWEPRVRRGLSRNHGFLRMVCYGLQRYPRHHMTPRPSTI